MHYKKVDVTSIRWQWEQVRDAKRNTTKGEWRALLTLVDVKGFKLDLTFDQFKNIVTKPCTYCGDVTPGYESNSINPSKPGTYDVQSTPICWPCKNLLGVRPKELLSQVLKVAKYQHETKGATADPRKLGPPAPVVFCSEESD